MADQSHPRTYHQWAIANRPTPADLEQMCLTVRQGFRYRPTISIVMPTYNTPEALLIEAIESVIEQTYPHWELCIADDRSSQPQVRQILERYQRQDQRIKVVFRAENGHISRASNSALEIATGDYVALLDHDDLLTPDALFEVASLLQLHPDADMIYTDEDKIDEKGILSEPTCKPAWSPDSFLTRMYICHLTVYRRSILKQIGGFRAGFEGSQDYDLALRFTEQTDRVYHISRVLYHWRIHSGSAAGSTDAKPYAYEAAQKGLSEAIARRGEPGQVQTIPKRPGHYRIRYDLVGSPLVSLIVFGGDRPEDLQRCLNGIHQRTDYGAYEVVMVFGRPQLDPAFRPLLHQWQGQWGDRLRAIAHDGFQWAAAANQAVQQARGDYLVFWEDGMEPINRDWLTRLVAQAQRSRVGAAAPIVLDPEQQIEQAGLTLGLNVEGLCLYQGIDTTVSNYANLAHMDLANNVSAVRWTGLCCRRSAWGQVGGFDPRLGIFAADLDLCLKLRSIGLRHLLVPEARLRQHHPQAWLHLLPDAETHRQTALQILQTKWDLHLRYDLCYSPALAGVLDRPNFRSDYERLQALTIHSQQPLVTIAMPTYNGRAYLEPAIASVQHQTYPHWELFISDDGSTDGTIETLQSWAERDPLRVQLVGGPRSGMVANWNHCADFARGKYLKFLHQDDLLDPDCLKAMVALAESDPEIGLVFAPRRLLLEGAAAQDPACQQLAAESDNLHHGWSHLQEIQDGSALLADPKLFLAPINKLGEPSAVLIRTDALRAVGGFDPELKQLVDLELWLRLLARYRVGFVTRPLSARRIHPAQVTQQNAADQELTRDAARFYQKVVAADWFGQLHPQAQQMAQGMVAQLAGLATDRPPDRPVIRSQRPPIPPIPAGEPRPLWSVMMPVYNPDPHELELALRSVLDQALPPEQMQIAVVDDASDRLDVAAIVRRVGGDRVSYHRQAQNRGLLDNWHDCLSRSRGQWVLLLHQDDGLLPGFVTQMTRAIQQVGDRVGAVLCRHHHIDSAGRVIWTSELERETAGVIADWPARIAQRQRVQFSAIGVRRSAYEQVGGFDAAAASAADWEMWQRLASRWELWFEPQPLAVFRRHDRSTTSQLSRTGANIADTRRVIALAQAYWPADQRAAWAAAARSHYAQYALSEARDSLAQADAARAIAQLREALRCDDHPEIQQTVIALLRDSGPPEPAIAAADPIADPVTDPAMPLVREITPLASMVVLFVPLVHEVKAAVASFRHRPTDDSAIARLRQARRQLAEQWLRIPFDRLNEAYLARLGQAHKAVVETDLRYHPLTDEERSLVNPLTESIDGGLKTLSQLRSFIVLMMYCRAYHLPLEYGAIYLPQWFLEPYALYMQEAPLYFQELGEPEQFAHHLMRWTNQVYSTNQRDPEDEAAQKLTKWLAYRGQFTPLYFTNDSPTDIYRKRAKIITQALINDGQVIEHQFPPRDPQRRKLRVGVLKDHFTPQTETFTTLPAFEQLDRSRFELILYSVFATGHPLERYCTSRADRFVHLQGSLAQQAATIRADDLDLLLIGTNVTMVTNPITVLAVQRLARVQVMSTSAPVTTGMATIDAYISGSLTEATDAQTRYTEKLLAIEGPAHAFNYDVLPQTPTVTPTRASWGAGDRTTVFMSGANFNKIVPELRAVWVRLLAQVADSVLVLYPFNPNWGQNYPGQPFIDRFRADLAAAGVDPARLVVLNPLPSIADIRECLKLGDIYLDSFPFAGVNSTIDPLLVGMPPVVLEGDSFRSRMASALLRSLRIPELIATTEAEYSQLAVRLAHNRDLRLSLGDRVRRAMAANPVFFDSPRYSTLMGMAFEQLFAAWQRGELGAR
ncbi:MAG: glycosyltransferase [Oscillatoriales cyanobacterium]|nr:MAG: glycosyltransferase [Oscillatoriales cyanobacterium]